MPGQPGLQLIRPILTGGIAAAALAALGACAAVPAVTAAIPKPLRAYATTASFAAPTAHWPNDRWWTTYGDAQLDGLVEEALAGAPDLAQAQARLAKAEAQAGQARAALLPQITANASLAPTKQSYNNGFPPAFVPHGYQASTKATVDFSWELDFFGKNRAALAAAVSEAEASRADAAEARLVLSTNVATTYANLAQQFADRDAAADAVRIRSQSATLTAERFANGLENRSAVEQARAKLAGARADLAAADEQIGLTRNSLAALLGAGPDRGLAIARPRVGALKAFGLPTNLQADLIGRRPDVVAARLRIDASFQRVKEAKAEFYPNINLSAYFGQQSLGLSTFTNPGSAIGSLGPALSLPIFQGGSLRAKYRGAAADRDLAVANYNAAVAKALQDIADAAVSSRALTARLDQSRQALEASRSAYALALERYRGGLATYLDVLSAEDQLIAEQQTVGDLETRAFSLDVALVRALGGGFHTA